MHMKNLSCSVAFEAVGGAEELFRIVDCCFFVEYGPVDVVEKEVDHHIYCPRSRSGEVTAVEEDHFRTWTDLDQLLRLVEYERVLAEEVEVGYDRLGVEIQIPQT